MSGYEDALENLGNYAHIYPLTHLNKEWTTKEYGESICEDFIMFLPRIFNIIKEGRTMPSIPSIHI